MSASNSHRSVGATGQNAFADQLLADQYAHPDRFPTQLPTVAPFEWFYGDLQQQDTQYKHDRNDLADQVSAACCAHPDRSPTQPHTSTPFEWYLGDVKQQDSQFKDRNDLADQVSAVRCAHPDRSPTQPHTSTPFEWDFGDVKQQDTQFKDRNDLADQVSAVRCAHPDRSPTQPHASTPFEWDFGDVKQQDTQFKDRNDLADQVSAVRCAHPDRSPTQPHASTPFEWDFGDVKQQDTQFKDRNDLADQVSAVCYAHPDRSPTQPQASTPFEWDFGDVKQQNTQFKGQNAFADELSADHCAYPDRSPTQLPTVAPYEWFYRELQRQNTQFKDDRNDLADQVSAVRCAHPDRSPTQPQASTPFEWDFGDVKQQDTQFKDRNDLADQVSAVCYAHPDRSPTQPQASTPFEWDFGDVKQQNTHFKGQNAFADQLSADHCANPDRCPTQLPTVAPFEWFYGDLQQQDMQFEDDKNLPCIGRPILGRGLMLTKNISGLEYNHGERVEVACKPLVNRQEAFMPTINVPVTKKNSVKEHFERPVKRPVNSYANGSINCFTKYVKAKQMMIPPLNGQENASMSGSVNGQVKKAIKRPLNGRPSGPMKGLVYGHAKEQMKQPLHYFVNSQTNEAIKHPVNGQTNGSFKGSVNGQAKEEMEHPENGHAKQVIHHLVLVNGESMRATKCRKAVEETIDEDDKWERACPTNQTTNLQLKVDLEMEEKTLPFDFNVECLPSYWTDLGQVCQTPGTRRKEKTFVFGDGLLTPSIKTNSSPRTYVSKMPDKNTYKMGMNGNAEFNTTRTTQSYVERLNSTTISTLDTTSHNNCLYSTKVFVGGLPQDTVEADIIESFEPHGVFSVDWPYKEESHHQCPPKGFAFLMFQDEHSVHVLVAHCKRSSDGSYYAQVSSSSFKNKLVEVRPWILSHAKFIQNKNKQFNHRHTVFVGGISRTMKAHELASFMDDKFGAVAYVGIDTDLQLKYPKGSSRVIFEKHESFVMAIATRFVNMMEGHLWKKIELKPYMLDYQMCDECRGERSGGTFAPYFCANVACLKYFCEACWQEFHVRVNLTLHRPTTKPSPTDRPRAMNYK